MLVGMVFHRLKQVVGLCLACALSCFAKGSDRYEILEAGEETYRNAVVRSVNASSILIAHSKGIAQVPFASVSAELQQKYGYDAKADENRQRELNGIRSSQLSASKKRLKRLREEAKAAEAKKVQSTQASRFGAFGKEPELKEEVDLRPAFRELGIGVRNQGRRPSCAIHAIVGALEYLEGSLSGEAKNFSEYYLYWATLKTLGRFDQSSHWVSRGEDEDAGFLLPEVLQAIRTFGIPTIEEAPGLGNSGIGKEAEPPSTEIVEIARQRVDLRSFSVPGRTREVRLGNIVHALNTGAPVVIGMGWPYFHSIRKTALIESQKPRPGYGHAVTLVGYRCPSGRMEDIKFIFRNSWGAKWGAGGYGFVKYEYIVKHLFDAHVIESSG